MCNAYKHVPYPKASMRFSRTMANSIAAVALAAFGLNAMLSGSIRQHTYANLDKMEAQVQKAKIEHPYDPAVDGALAKISAIRVGQPSVLAPFWHSYRTQEQAEDLYSSIHDAVAMYTRTLHVGLGYDKRDPDRFLAAVAGANESLSRYGIRLAVDECIDLVFPAEPVANEIVDGVKNSFSKPLDLRFAWTGNDLCASTIDYAIYAQTESGVCIIDCDLQEEDLERTIEQETLRRLVRAKGLLATEGSKRYFCEYDAKTILARKDTLLPSEEKPGSVQTGRRVVTVNVGLDSIELEKARRLMAALRDTYERKFGIEIRPLCYYPHTLPGKCYYFNEIAKIERFARTKSDIYLLLTGRDWNTKDMEAGSSMSGRAYINSGYALVECHAPECQVLRTLYHEFGHLFRANHVYRKDAIMHPYSNPKSDLWTAYTISTILENKFRTWDSGIELSDQ